MAELPETLGFYLDGIYCYADASDPQMFYYIPGKPQPELDALGKPILSLWVSDRGALLQLQTRWAIASEQLMALKQELARRHTLEVSQIQLRSAPITQPQVLLAIGNRQAEFQTVETVQSSGIAPYSAIFNTPLTAPEKDSAVAALNGNANSLSVTYQGELQVQAIATAVIEGDVSLDVQQLIESATRDETPNLRDRIWGKPSSPSKTRSPLSLDACLRQIEAALQTQRLNLKWTGAERASLALQDQVSQQVKQNAAHQLLHLAQSLRLEKDKIQTSHLQTTAQASEIQTYEVKQQTDISTWFIQSRGTDLIRVSPVSLEEPSRTGDQPAPDQESPTSTEPTSTEMTIQLGFDGSDAPIASIQVTWGSDTASLQRPAFEPVVITGDGELLVIETRYTLGGPAFVTKLPISDSQPQIWTLTPEQLGLASIVVDGSRPQAEGAKKARITVRYQPSGSGTPDSKIINFHQRDRDWQAHWYVITRSSELDGVIEWYWQETPAQGAGTKHPPVRTQTPPIQL